MRIHINTAANLINQITLSCTLRYIQPTTAPLSTNRTVPFCSIARTLKPSISLPTLMLLSAKE